MSGKDYVQPESKNIIREVRSMEEDVEKGVKENKLKYKYYNIKTKYPNIYKRILEKKDLTTLYDVLEKMIDVIDGKKTIEEVSVYALEQQRKEEKERLEKN